MDHKILVAGIGNIFLGDDGFGPAVATLLASRNLGGDVLVKDYGIRSYDLVFALLQPYQTVFLVDAISKGGTPGSLYLIEPSIETEVLHGVDAHSMDPRRVLQMVRDMGGTTSHILIVGCQPATFGQEGEFDEGSMELSEPVQAAVEQAADWVESLVRQARDRINETKSEERKVESLCQQN